jgi:hypothetical protein
LTEAAFLLSREGRQAHPLFALLERGAIRIALNFEDEQAGSPPLAYLRIFCGVARIARSNAHPLI